MRCCFLVVLSIGLVTAEAAAAPPDVKTLFPPGGQRGQSVVVTVGGKLNTRRGCGWALNPPKS